MRVDADEGADVLRGYVARDEGSARLGEVALVDGDGRIGKLDTVFYDTLLDENAASHIALGEAYAFTAGEEDHPRLNHSSIHVDFMIGGDEVAVTGITGAGEASRSCAAAPGSSVAFALPRAGGTLPGAWRGAGAVERARLEIA